MMKDNKCEKCGYKTVRLSFFSKCPLCKICERCGKRVNDCICIEGEWYDKTENFCNKKNSR